MAPIKVIYVTCDPVQICDVHETRQNEVILTYRNGPFLWLYNCSQFGVSARRRLSVTLNQTLFARLLTTLGIYFRNELSVATLAGKAKTVASLNSIFKNSL